MIRQSRKTEALQVAIIDGSKTDINTTAEQFQTASQVIKKGILVRCRSLGTGTYVAIGNATSQNLRLISVDSFVFIDWIDNVNKIYVKTDAGNTSAIEWNGS